MPRIHGILVLLEFFRASVAKKIQNDTLPNKCSTIKSGLYVYLSICIPGNWIQLSERTSQERLFY
jgi:hypothetical protein